MSDKKKKKQKPKDTKKKAKNKKKMTKKQKAFEKETLQSAKEFKAGKYKSGTAEDLFKALGFENE